MTDSVLSLLELNSRIVAAVASDRSLHDVWVTAETVDMRVSGGHCYFELIEKDPSTARPIARMRAVIWASQYGRISAEFLAATGQRLASDQKIMVKVSVNFHPVFGLSAIVTEINPEFTCGDLIRRRQLMIKRLTDEGIIDMNKTLPWPDVPWRVAVISAKGAAGYGDFITHLFTNPSRLRFSVKLFPAVLQGESAPKSLIDALDSVAADADDFDCVVIIRGGGATGDLASFDDYDLAANVAQFPLPVIVGIGHERDVTILDYVASVRVKTPTAAAEWLIDKSETALGRIRDLASEIFRSVSTIVSGSLQQLAYYQGLLPSLVHGKIDNARTKLDNVVPDTILRSVDTIVGRHRDRLESISQLINALSPESVLKRGYSVCRIDGHAVTDASLVSEGSVMTTTLAKGTIISTVSNTGQ